MSGKQPEESPEGNVGRSEYRQARERSTAEGSIQRDGVSFRAIKEHCSAKTRARARIGGSWCSRLERISKEVNDQ